ncbi:MAG: hypothetical protein KDD70_05205 [Bdellovibrionales bacterium]|nr:hypothetical protein [Bdellovibrionales bacterium]
MLKLKFEILEGSFAAHTGSNSVMSLDGVGDDIGVVVGDGVVVTSGVELGVGEGEVVGVAVSLGDGDGVGDGSSNLLISPFLHCFTKIISSRLYVLLS